MNDFPPPHADSEPCYGAASDPDLIASLREQYGQDPQPDWDAMEQRLLDVFAGHRVTHEPRRSRWAAVAAMLVLTAGAWWQLVSSDRPMAPTSSLDSPRVATSEPPAAATPVSATVTTPVTAPLAVTARMRPARSRGVAAVKDPVDPFAESVGFVTLPGAGALPDFESGHIVRVELAIAGLPAYGLEPAADTASAPIEADLLVGQDGVPRAIRLASTNQ